MNESVKSYGKFYLILVVLIFGLLSKILNNKSYFDNINLSVTITLGIAAIYSNWLWKYNPLEKKPKIYGKYEMTFISTHDKKERIMHVIIKQDLFSNRIYMNTNESESETISSNIIIKKDSCELIYTYQNAPNPIERDHSEIHNGTCKFKIVNNVIISGEYYTDRKTTGEIKNIKKMG